MPAFFLSGPPLQTTSGNASGAFPGTQRPNWSGLNATTHGAITDRLNEFLNTREFTFSHEFTFGGALRTMTKLGGPG